MSQSPQNWFQDRRTGEHYYLDERRNIYIFPESGREVPAPTNMQVARGEEWRCITDSARSPRQSQNQPQVHSATAYHHGNTVDPGLQRPGPMPGIGTFILTFIRTVPATDINSTEPDCRRTRFS